MHVISAHAHDYMDMLVKVVDIICSSCTVMHMQGAHGVCALRALVNAFDILPQMLMIINHHDIDPCSMPGMCSREL